jgi:hypothetical protein
MALRQPTRFTTHAFERVLQRLALSHAEVAAILDHDLAVMVGIDSFSNRLRRVFLSVPDSEFFVAVQDIRNGEVVTVLPLDYHANLRWPIKEKHLVEAAAKMGRPAPNVRGLAGVIPKVPRSAIRIACAWPDKNGSPRLKNLGSWPAEEAPADIALLAHIPEFVREIMTRAAAKGIPCRSPLQIYLRLGKDGERVDVIVDPAIASNPSKREPPSGQLATGAAIELADGDVVGRASCCGVGGRGEI